MTPFKYVHGRRSLEVGRNWSVDHFPRLCVGERMFAGVGSAECPLPCAVLWPSCDSDDAALCESRQVRKPGGVLRRPIGTDLTSASMPTCPSDFCDRSARRTASK